MIYLEFFSAVIEDKTFHDLNPRGCGCLACPPGETLGLTNRNYTMIHYVVSGKGKVYINDEELTVKKGQIFTIPEGIDNRYVADDVDPWAFIWIVFDGNLSDRFATLPTVMDFHSGFFFELLNVKNMTTMKKEYLAQMLFRLYIELFENDSRMDYVKAIKNYIDNNYMHRDISVKKIAESLNLNRSYVSRMFSRNEDNSIQDYIIHVRMLRAKELLYKGISVQNTASFIGYSDQSQFSKAFKKAYGYSPSVYRKKIMASEKFEFTE